MPLYTCAYGVPLLMVLFPHISNQSTPDLVPFGQQLVPEHVWNSISGDQNVVVACQLVHVIPSVGVLVVTWCQSEVSAAVQGRSFANVVKKLKQSKPSLSV